MRCDGGVKSNDVSVNGFKNHKSPQMISIKANPMREDLKNDFDHAVSEGISNGKEVLNGVIKNVYSHEIDKNVISEDQ